MWKIPSHSKIIVSAASIIVLSTHMSLAQSSTTNNQTFGFSLPNPPMSGGFDEIKAADGTTCRSSMSGNGPFLDIGGISGRPNQQSDTTLLAYGRVIIPLGKKPRRLDCQNLYQLEIERLRHEIRMIKSGIGNAQVEDNESASWQHDGWDNNSDDPSDMPEDKKEQEEEPKSQ